MNYSIAFYRTIKRYFVGSQKAKNRHIVYNNGDQHKLYAKERKYDTIGNSNQPFIQQPQPSPTSTTKEDNTRWKRIQQQTATGKNNSKKKVQTLKSKRRVVKKKSGKRSQKRKKQDTTRIPKTTKYQ